MRKFIPVFFLCVIPFLGFAQLEQRQVSKNETKIIWQADIENQNANIEPVSKEDNKGITNEMINIPLDYDGEAGVFLMGKEGATSNVFEVTLTYNYDMSKYMITNAMYAEMLNYAHAEGLLTGDYDGAHTTVKNAEGTQYEILDLDGSFEVTCQIEFSGGEFNAISGLEDYPVYYVSWYGAAFYCNMESRQNELTELYDQTTDPWKRTFYGEDGFRIPTEHEWEYAATYNDNRDYPWGMDVATTDHCNFLPSGIGHSTPVNQYPLGVSNLGLMDMAGNLSEIVNNYIFSYSTEPETNPTGPDNDGEEHRIALKGNTFEADEEVIKCHWRSGWTRQWYPTNTGSFRIVRVYSGEIPNAINSTAKPQFRINNYPNPVNDFTTFCYSLENDDNITIRIYDSKGVLVHTINRTGNRGRNAIQFNASNLNSGIYFYRIETSNKTISNILIKN